MFPKDYDAMVASQGRPTFTVGGQSFQARAKIPWRRLQALLDVMSSAEVSLAEGAERFLSTAVIKADRERFLSLLHVGADEQDDDDGGEEQECVSTQQLNAILDDLLEHYTGKLEDSAGSSSPGPPGTGRPRKVVSLDSRKAAG